MFFVHLCKSMYFYLCITGMYFDVRLYLSMVVYVILRLSHLITCMPMFFYGCYWNTSTISSNNMYAYVRLCLSMVVYVILRLSHLIICLSMVVYVILRPSNIILFMPMYVSGPLCSLYLFPPSKTLT